MDPLLSEILKKHNEANKEPLTAEELEDLEMEDFLSEMPKGGHLEQGYEEGVDTPVDNPSNYGMTTTQGALSEHDWDLVDIDQVREAVASALHTTVEDLQHIYGPGGKTEEDLRLRSQIDERLLQVVEEGASKVLIAKALGWGLKKPHNKSPVMQKALARARGQREARGNRDT